MTRWIFLAIFAKLAFAQTPSRKYDNHQATEGYSLTIGLTERHLTTLPRAQVSASFAPSDHDPRLPGVTTWSVGFANRMATALGISDADVREGVQGHFVWKDRASVLRIARTHRQGSTVGKILVLGEILGWGAVSGEAAYQAFRRSEPNTKQRLASQLDRGIAAAAPALALGTRLGQSLIRKNHPEFTLPDNLLDNWIALPPHGSSKEYVVFGQTTAKEESFTIMVRQP